MLTSCLATFTDQTVSEGDTTESDRLAERLRFREEQCRLWSTVKWDNKLAIDRHIELLQSFERGDRDHSVPLEEFEMPWPILPRPLSYSIAEIETEWVSNFYDDIRKREEYSHADIVSLIRRCIKVFHEDKLVSRLREVDGDEDKALVNEVAKLVYLELYDQLQRQRGEGSGN